MAGRVVRIAEKDAVGVVLANQVYGLGGIQPEVRLLQHRLFQHLSPDKAAGDFILAIGGMGNKHRVLGSEIGSGYKPDQLGGAAAYEQVVRGYI